MEVELAKKKKEAWKAKKKAHDFETDHNPLMTTMMEPKRKKPSHYEDDRNINSTVSDSLKRFKDHDDLYAEQLGTNTILLANGGTSGTAGGLALIWKSNLNVEITDFSLNHINAIVRPANGPPWIFTGYYGSPYDFNSKVESWKMLDKTVANNQLPWLVIGDFNFILHDTEKFSTQPIDDNEDVFFNNMILDLDLVDLGTTGCPFTWSNKRSCHALTEQRLDRGLATESWLLLYPNTSISNMLHIGAFLIARRLKDIKLKLRVWNKEVYGNIKTNIDECKQHLHWLHNNYFRHDQSQALDLARKHLKDWQDIEEKFWKTKSRDQFIKLGDQNTNYIHRTTKSRNRRNKIDKIQDNKGAWITDYQEIKNCFMHTSFL
ncbi:uncharacterized protein LOC113325853 [Papaver somniferum]|uniref:uncharacterized protein LOC113325853 n=1 Tax=Papaver somniferum TaxID=3469 RepID=UPI000E703A6D|nr:uncharacterized protein LOC113325853 [Papaver somniferum]